ncbi:sugar isomerase domain-containing protein [Amycolatopsis viridis]|uniref:Phosphosugar-binding protein n=1 Tax=Amycolatopsis viridis TaxID=185678 RepID=A0ABX0SSV0_9PSEU|nr:sugar isomerase domain-containing protein [Amycolatopsis viridis]NIH80043.1 putative phosphosugar-binding protein [Amycolatopsis viridis]
MIHDLVAGALERAGERNSAEIRQAAGLVLGAVRADALVFTAGAGHSLASVAETFYRAGGLACVYPLYHPDLLPLHSATTSTAAERRSGLAAQVLAERAPGPDDVVFVFSNSGVNPYPVELAEAVRAPVVAVTSRAAVAAAPRRSPSTLLDHADVVLDTGVRPGDASFPADDPRTVALSSLLNVYLWNEVLAHVHDAARREGAEVPLWRSSNMADGDAANAALLERYRPRVPALRQSG